MKIQVHQEICTKMFITSSFTVAQTGSNPNGYQRENGWTNCCFHTPEYYSAMSRHKLPIHTAMRLRHCARQEKSNTEKEHHTIPFIWSSRIELIYSGIFQKVMWRSSKLTSEGYRNFGYLHRRSVAHTGVTIFQFFTAKTCAFQSIEFTSLKPIK